MTTVPSPAALPATAPAAGAPLPVTEDGLLPLPAPLAQLLTLLDAPGRAGALAELQASGHVDAGTLPHWRALLSERTLAPRYVNDALVRVRLGVDRLLAANGGELTAGKTRAILARQIELAARCGEGARFGLATLQHTAVLDYGAGRFSPLSAALVLWADGDGDRRSFGLELQPLAATGIVAIELGYTSDRRCDARDNCEVERAGFTWRDGLGREHAGEVIDVHLACQ